MTLVANIFCGVTASGKTKILLLAHVFFLLSSLMHAQDTIKYPWPVQPFTSSVASTGTFCEFRNTGSSNHFHNGTDIPKPDGTAVYPVLSGTLTTISPTGTDAYVRVNSTVAGRTKNMAYVHIAPNPLLQVGDQVTVGVTVLGNILTGQGHTHLIDGAFNSEINPLRKEGGLFPYNDTFSPKVISVKFYQDNSKAEFTTNRISGYVDFVAHIVERNGDGTPNSGSTTNNGVPQVGYKILSADKSAVVYNPPSNGTRFKFDWKPSDGDVGYVYSSDSDLSTPIYILTNGPGNIGTSRLQNVTNNSFDTRSLTAGNYQMMVFAVDTRDNADTVYIPFEITTIDNVAPAPPVLQKVVNDSVNRITIAWYPNIESDLKGYRLYYSTNGSSWQLKDGENKLTRTTIQTSYNNISSPTTIYFRLTAVDSAGITNESTPSDVYGLRPNTQGQKILIVDGYDRTTGNYRSPTHPFAMTAGLSIPGRFETCSNDAVYDGSILLNDYHIVVWMLGDESISSRVFDSTEQFKTIKFLQNGGKLFVNGSDAAYDLDRPEYEGQPTQSDRDFLHQFLKTKYLGDAANSSTISGTSASIFQGMSFSFGDTTKGSPYRVDSPDYIDSMAGGLPAAAYSNGLNAAVVFKGVFPGGSTQGAVVFLSIPFETIQIKADRDAVMQRILSYFGIPVAVGESHPDIIPTSVHLFNGYPNPFNPITTIKFSVTKNGPVSVKIYDLLGRPAAELLHRDLTAGTYSVQWNAESCASGVYIVTLTAEGTVHSKQIVLLK